MSTNGLRRSWEETGKESTRRDLRLETREWSSPSPPHRAGSTCLSPAAKKPLPSPIRGQALLRGQRTLPIGMSNSTSELDEMCSSSWDRAGAELSFIVSSFSSDRICSLGEQQQSPPQPPRREFCLRLSNMMSVPMKDSASLHSSSSSSSPAVPLDGTEQDIVGLQQPQVAVEPDSPFKMPYHFLRQSQSACSTSSSDCPSSGTSSSAVATEEPVRGISISLAYAAAGVPAVEIPVGSSGGLFPGGANSLPFSPPVRCHNPVCTLDAVMQQQQRFLQNNLNHHPWKETEKTGNPGSRSHKSSEDTDTDMDLMMDMELDVDADDQVSHCSDFEMTMDFGPNAAPFQLEL